MRCRLKDIATIERAKKGKDYPEGVTLVQLSATRGQTHLHEGGEVKSHFAVVRVKKDSKVLPTFLYIYVKETIERNLEAVRTGLNITTDSLATYPIRVPMEVAH